VCRAGVEPAQRSRPGYSRVGSPVPSRHGSTTYGSRTRLPRLRAGDTSPEAERRVSESAWREPNPPVHLGGVVPRPLGHRRLSRRKERESNPQGLCGLGRSATGFRRHSICPPVSPATPSCTAVLAGCDRQLVSVGAAGFEPAFSCVRGRRPLQASPRPDMAPCESRKRLNNGASAVPPRGRGRERPRRESNPHALAGTPFTVGMFVRFCRRARLPEHPAGLEPAPPP
jgi:hypothetical protein